MAGIKLASCFLKVIYFFLFAVGEITHRQIPASITHGHFGGGRLVDVNVLLIGSDQNISRHWFLVVEFASFKRRKI